MKKILIFNLVIVSIVYGQNIDKLTLLPSGKIVYNLTPPSVDNISDMFSQSIWYGRLRLNSFFYDNPDNSKDYYTAGVGGSFIYKSGYFHNIGFSASIYNSSNPIHKDDDDASIYRGGKGVLSRYNVLNSSDYTLDSIAQLFFEYKTHNTSIKLGRFLFESALTKSNDTKMIPNSFEGISLKSRYFDNTEIKLAYLTQMKLRDHSRFHHILAYGDDANDKYSKYNQNDDSAMHRGLTQSKLNARGIDDRLLVLDVRDKSIDDLYINLNITAVPQLVSSAMIELGYNYLSNGYQISPAFKYMHQFDNGAGEIGGANLKNITTGYTNPKSVEGDMLASRVDISHDEWRLRFGYSHIFDEADLITPWRGFPTGGYTRAMGQYNWYANTSSYMIQANYNFDKAGLIPDMSAYIRYVIQDFDDKKVGVQADNKILTLDIIQKLSSNIYLKARTALNRAKTNIITSDGSIKPDSSYNEFRLELNYLF